ncbi:hypothetical protein EDB86DRAFT_2761638, partial [Lactarius hatsudake]
DFHQFPPVANTTKELYNSHPTDNRCLIGRSLFEQFDIVVRLQEQMRVRDSRWDAILHRAHTVTRTRDDIIEIRKLVLGSSPGNLPDFTRSPWNDTILITPRNAVQSLWNARMLKQHCRRTGHTRYTFYALDSCKWSPLSLQRRLEIAHLKLDKTNHLPHKVDIAIGMKAMLLYNTAPHAGLANGSRGIVIDIVLDPREPLDISHANTVQLSYLPTAIL